MQKTAWIMSLLCQFGINASRFTALGLNKNSMNRLFWFRSSSFIGLRHLFDVNE